LVNKNISALAPDVVTNFEEVVGKRTAHHEQPGGFSKRHGERLVKRGSYHPDREAAISGLRAWARCRKRAAG
jgi:hypothetical protein